MLTRTRPSPLFWLLAAATSVYCAEIISGNYPYPFFDAWGLSVVLPLYGLHLLVLAGLLFRRHWPNWPALYFAGVLFGLYEAYITKMLWNAPWGLPIHVAGIDLLATTTLILWWHPFMAFILPLFLLERFASGSRTLAAALPPGARAVLGQPAVQFGLAAMAGVLQSAASPAPGALFSALAGLLVVGGLLWLWRRFGNPQRPLHELLPSGLWLTLLGLALIGLYAWAIPRLRPQAFPGLGGQVTIWLLYAAFIWLLLRALRRSPSAPPPPESPGIPRRRALALLLTYLFITLLAGFLPANAKTLVFLLNALLGSAFGLYVLVQAIRQLAKDTPA